MGAKGRPAAAGRFPSSSSRGAGGAFDDRRMRTAAHGSRGGGGGRTGPRREALVERTLATFGALSACGCFLHAFAVRAVWRRLCRSDVARAPVRGERPVRDSRNHFAWRNGLGRPRRRHSATGRYARCRAGGSGHRLAAGDAATLSRTRLAVFHLGSRCRAYGARDVPSHCDAQSDACASEALMCGFVGGVFRRAVEPSDAEALRRAVRTLAHRGPDAEGVEVVGGANAVLAFRRLAIIDLATG